MPVLRSRWVMMGVAILLGAAACKPKPGRNGILAVNDMKVVMLDIMQADEFATSYIIKDSSKELKKETNELYQKIFAIHKTDQAAFYKSFDFYRTHPEYYKILLDSLSAFGNREREGRFLKKKVNPIPVRLPKDSATAGKIAPL